MLKNQKTLFLKLVLYFFALTNFSLYPTNRQNSFYLKKLMSDIKHYKTTSSHRGNLYEHSMWTEQYISKWSKNNTKMSYLCSELNDREKYILALAGLLHDIGKAGTPNGDPYYISFHKNKDEIYYFTKCEHEQIGFEYMLHDICENRKGSNKYKRYIKYNGKPFNFKKLFLELKLTKDEQKILAILVGMHRQFSQFMMQEISLNSFFKKLNFFTVQSNYTKGITKSLLIMTIAISIADAMAASFPVKTGCSLVFSSFKKCHSPHSFEKKKHGKFIKKMKLMIPKIPLYLNELLLNFQNLSFVDIY